jgi:hypothetical protein
VLSVTGVHTAIAGTAKAGRFLENAVALQAGELPGALLESIRQRWREVAASDWAGKSKKTVPRAHRARTFCNEWMHAHSTRPIENN